MSQCLLALRSRAQRVFESTRVVRRSGSGARSVVQGEAWLVAVMLALPTLLESESAAAQPVLSSSPSVRGTPGLWRLGLPAAVPAQWGIAALGGYGFTESQPAGEGSHHRWRSQAGAHYTPRSGLDLGWVTSFRYDRHSRADPSGLDSGATVDSEVTAQWGRSHSQSWHWGALTSAAFVGGTSVGRSLQNPVLQAQALGAYLPSPGLLLAAGIGYRHDLSAGAVLSPDSYRVGDRLALGLSDFDAIPLAVGARYRFGAWEGLTEMSGDALVGAGAPPLAQSPWRATGALRRGLGEGKTAGLLLDCSLSERPDASLASSRLVPVEPRVTLLASLAMSFSHEHQAATLPTNVEFRDAMEPRADAATSPVAAVGSSLEVQVTTAQGDPLSDATVEVIVSAARGASDERGARIIVPHARMEQYRAEGVPAGQAIIIVAAPRLKTQRQQVTLVAGKPLKLSVQLEPEPLLGQLRGLVRSFGGKPLVARVRVSPGDTEVASDDRGVFQLDLVPGQYTVEIVAAGHASQRRQVTVASNGVVVLNADLERTRP